MSSTGVLALFYTKAESDSRYITQGTLDATLATYATTFWVEQKGYLTAVPQPVTTTIAELGTRLTTLEDKVPESLEVTIIDYGARIFQTESELASLDTGLTQITTSLQAQVTSLQSTDGVHTQQIN